jgi:hypothetical protein
MFPTMNDGQMGLLFSGVAFACFLLVQHELQRRSFLYGLFLLTWMAVMAFLAGMFLGGLD